MDSKWRKAKMALGLNLCTYVPSSHVDTSDDDNDDKGSLSSTKAAPPSSKHSVGALPSPATPGLHGSKLSKSLSRSSKVVS